MKMPTSLGVGSDADEFAARPTLVDHYAPASSNALAVAPPPPKCKDAKEHTTTGSSNVAAVRLRAFAVH